MTTQLNVIETNENGIKWIEISGKDNSTKWEFDGAEIFGITEDNRILDRDGCPPPE